MDTAEVLALSADHIAAHGLYRGSPGIADGPIATAPACAVGAIHIVTTRAGQPRLALPALEALVDHIGTWVIADWSDSSSEAEVVEALRAAARSIAPQLVGVS